MLNTAFIDAVWQPFETIEDFLFELLTLQVDDHLDYVSNNWQKVRFLKIFLKKLSLTNLNQEHQFNTTLPAKLFLAFKVKKSSLLLVKMSLFFYKNCHFFLVYVFKNQL